ncbi:MAG: glutamyl-tRNA reductase [Marinifilaceae bacterium]|jgi:glutamyl-tRNA reductase|nr:glutamyl-tRNA reductase [Marinifilaceae bacterium]
MSIEIKKNLDNFFVIGVSYIKTSIDLRGKFSLNEQERLNILTEAKKIGVESLFVLSTCNRTEIYAHTSKFLEVKELFIRNREISNSDFDNNIYTYKSKECVHHLFKVSSGLDSQIIGDFQIVGQVKDAFREAKKYNMINSFMDRLLSLCFKTSKRIKNETEISKGASSVSHAAVQYIKDKVNSLEESKILLFGTGEIGRDTCDNLLKHMQNREITLINRTSEKAEMLAKKFNVNHSSIESLSEEVYRSDIIIVATGSNQPTLLPEHLGESTQCKLILDLSVPANVHKDIFEMPHVLVITVDMLSQHISKALSKRKNAIPKAQMIIGEGIGEFFSWLEVKFLSPIIVALKDNLKKIQESELEYHKNHLNDTEIETIDQITGNIVNKIAKACINHLKDNHKRQASPMETLEMIFKDM